MWIRPSSLRAVRQSHYLLTGKIISLNPARPGWGKFFCSLKLVLLAPVILFENSTSSGQKKIVTLSGVPPGSSRPDLIENQGAAGLRLGERVADDADADQDGAAHVDDAPQA